MKKLIADFRNHFKFSAEGKAEDTVTQEELQGAIDANIKAASDLQSEQEAHAVTKAQVDALTADKARLEAELKAANDAKADTTTKLVDLTNQVAALKQVVEGQAAIIPSASKGDAGPAMSDLEKEHIAETNEKLEK